MTGDPNPGHPAAEHSAAEHPAAERAPGRRAVFRPSRRGRSAQRMQAVTLLACESLLVLLAGLAEFALGGREVYPLVLTAVFAVLLLAAIGLLQRPGGYVVGTVLQVCVLLLGLMVPMMWVVGGLFLALWVLAMLVGRRLDAEKDQLDAQVRAEREAGGEAG